MAQADPSTTTASKYAPTPEMMTLLALLIALDLKAEDKGKVGPSVHVIEALQAMAGDPEVVSIKTGRPMTERPFSGPASRAHAFLKARFDGRQRPRRRKE